MEQRGSEANPSGICAIGTIRQHLTPSTPMKSVPSVKSVDNS